MTYLVKKCNTAFKQNNAAPNLSIAFKIVVSVK